MKTYRERVQALVDVIESCYNEIGILRDYSDGPLTDRCNMVRSLLRDASSGVRELDNATTDSHAMMVTKSNGLCKD